MKKTFTILPSLWLCLFLLFSPNSSFAENIPSAFDKNNNVEPYISTTINNLSTTGTGLCFEALVDCDDNAGTNAAFGEMYVHISNVANADGTNPITFTSSTGTVIGTIAAAATSGTIQITGLTAADFGTLITLTADNNGTMEMIEIPVPICGFSVDTGGDGNMEDDVSNGTFCTSQNGATAPGILTQVIGGSNILSGNNITSSYTYTLVDNTNGDAIIATNMTGIFDAGDGISNMNDYTVYAFYVSDAEQGAFDTAYGALTNITTGDDVLTGMGAFANICYNFCCSAMFTPNCCTADAGDLTTSTTTTDFIICEGLDLLDDAMVSAVFTNIYTETDETDPNVNDPADYETAYITADASGNILEYNSTGDFDFSNDAVYTGGNTYSIYVLNYKVDNTPNTALAYLAALSPSTIAQIIADDSDMTSGGAGTGSFCLDISGLDLTGTQVTVMILPEPVVANQTGMICSDVASGITLGASTSGTAVATYNITSIVNNGLTASAGSPATGNGLTNSEIVDDAFTNTTGANVDIVYTIVPVSADGCEGDPFTVTLTVNSEPVGSDPTPALCSNTALNVDLQGLITNGQTNVTFSWTSVDNPDVDGETASSNTTSITDNLTNTSGSMQVVVYTVVPTSSVADGACAGDPFTVTVTLDSEPVVEDQTTAVCSGSATGVTLGASTNATAVATYNITNVNAAAGLTGAGTSGTGLANNAIAGDIFMNPTTGSLDVVYTITPISAGTCAGDPFTVTVTIDPMVDVDLSAVATDICYKSATDLIDLSGDYISGATNTGTWTTSGDGTFNDASNMHPAVTAYTTGASDRSQATVTLTLTADPSNTCPIDSDDITVTIKDVTCTNNSFFSGNN